MNVEKGLTAVIIALIGGLFLLATGTLNQAKATTPVKSIHQTDLSVNVVPVISLGITNCDSSQTNYEHITITAKATTNGGFSSDCQNLTISTNTPGYSLEARAVSSNNTNNLVHTTNSSLFIPIIPAPASPTNPFSNATALTTNQWGFALTTSLDKTNQPISYFDSSYAKNDSTNKYANLPTTDTELYRRDQQPTAIDSFQAYYATKIDITQPAGYYQTTITYTVTSEPVPEPPTYAKVVDGASFQDTTIHQNRSCSALTIYDGTNPEAIITMTDNRNNQQYQVAKLADNKCWMLNNLKLGSTTATTLLTPENTNITTAWSLPQVNESGSPSTTNYYDQPKVDAIPGQTDNTDNTDSNFYGYYYNWCAATAGGTDGGGDTNDTCTIGTVKPTDATSDICPSNWRLPKGGNWDAIANDFGQLNIAMYNNGSGTTSSNYSDQDHANNWNFAGPFKGVFSGYRNTSTWYNVGTHGNFLSGSHHPSNFNTMFGIGFGPELVYPNDQVSGRGLRLTVRCLVTP